MIAGMVFLMILSEPARASRQDDARTFIQPSGVDSVLVSWRFLKETPSLFDVWARIVRCDGKNVVELKLFNENPKEQSVSFDIIIAGADGKTLLKKSYSETLKGGVMKVGNCLEGKEPALVLIIPGKADVNTISLSATIINDNQK